VRRTLPLLLAAAALLYGAAQAALHTPAAEALLRTRIRAALAPRLGDVAIGEARVDPLFRVSFGPLALPLRRGEAPAVRIERVRVRPSATALLAGRLEPGRIDLLGITFPPPLSLGPFDAALLPSRGPRGDRLAATIRSPGGGRAEIEASRDASGFTARLRATGIGPRDLPPALRAASGGVVAGTLALEVEVDGPPDLSRAEARVRAVARDVTLAGERIAPAPVGPLRATAGGVLSWDRAARRLSLRDGTAEALGAVPVAASGEIELVAGLPFTLSVRAGRIDYAALAAALPAGLAPPPAAPRPPGAFAARLDLSGPLATPAAWTVDAALDLSGLRAAARRSAPSPLAGPFVHRPDPADPRRQIVVGPESPDFVPVAELPEHVIRAVTTSEDAGFFAHAGFDFDELRNAFAEGAEAGRVVRGGSTITQQLAKNLFLSPERTLARKVREAMIAIALEATLPKRRLLEIYLNVAEWGPGLWGIGPAARHWFGKDARALTAKEAAFLASIIPSPIRYHAMYARGAPSDAWEARVNGLLFKMTEQGALSDDQLVEGLSAPLYFEGG